MRGRQCGGALPGSHMRMRMTTDTQTGSLQRRQVIDDIVARTGIDEPMIERLVRAFYERARRDPLIGPIFESKVDDWERHIGKLCAFWSSVALMSGRYHGQPMIAHLPLPVDTPEFDRWLEIFAETARDVCPPSASAHFLERAHRYCRQSGNGYRRPKGRNPAETITAGTDHAENPGDEPCSLRRQPPVGPGKSRNV